MAQDDIILERIAPGPYNFLRKWSLSRRYSDVSRSDIVAISGCALKNETTLLGRPKSATIGVTDDAVLVSDGRRFFGSTERIDAEEAKGRGVEIRERRDTAKENALATGSLLSDGMFSSPSVERADVSLPNPSGSDVEIKVEKRTKSGTQVVDQLRELFPRTRETGESGSDGAMERLRKRYVDGEISKQEFEERKETISD